MSTWQSPAFQRYRSSAALTLPAHAERYGANLGAESQPSIQARSLSSVPTLLSIATGAGLLLSSSELCGVICCLSLT